MKIDQNIKDTIKASVVIVTVIILIVSGIEIYNAVTYNEAEESYGFLKLAQTLHNDLDDNEVRDNFHNLFTNISYNQIRNPKEIDSSLNTGLRLMRDYKERYYSLYSPTEEMRAIKESLVDEGSLFLSSYSYLRKSWESKNNNDYDAYLLNIEQAVQYFNDAMDLRVQNGEELSQWKMKIEAELSN